MMVVAVLTGYSHWAAVLLFLIVWRLIQDYVISPRIMGVSVELHPLAALFGDSCRRRDRRGSSAFIFPSR